MNKNFLLVYLLAAIVQNSYAQQPWTGTTTTGVTTRDGNVGIGTITPPTVKLEVNNGDATLPSFLKVDPLAANGQMSLTSTSVNSNATFFDIRNKRGTGATTNGGWSGLTLSYDASLVLPDTGPNSSTLLIRNDDVNLAVLQFTNQNSTYSINNLSKLIEIDANTSNKFARTSLSTAHANHFRWEFDGSEKMRINSSGNVAIGTTLSTNPNNYKLAVNGKIGAKEVQVENTSSTWADYVFYPDYKLISLQEVESFIKINKHLPEIPSAEEVKTNGHKLGEMDVLLLKKVEELTLYVIELEKKISALENSKK